MNTHDFSMIREPLAHGDLRFHMMLHEFSSDPTRTERVGPHWHEECELLMVTNGGGEARLGGHALEIAAGDLLFIDAGVVHSLSAPVGTPLAFYAVDFGLELLASYGSDDIQQKYIRRQRSGELRLRERFRPDDAGYGELLPPLEEIRRLHRQDVSGSELLIKADLLRIWHFLCLYPAAAAGAAQKNEDEKLVLTKKILQFLRDHYAEPLTLRTLAAQLHMSEGQFCRFFKAQVHMTAMEYLNYYRIGAACDLLRDGAPSVSAVALSCGYGNISYFNRQFRRYMHCTPREYAAQLRREK